MRIEINPEHPEPRKIARAVHILREGGCVAYPTDTVYALGCAMSHKKAVDALYDMKRMKREQALALMVPDLSGIAQFAVVHAAQYRFLKPLVPGPYVFIVEATREVPKLLMMKRKTIGIRVPEHPVARALVEALGEPLSMSTNMTSGRSMICFRLVIFVPLIMLQMPLGQSPSADGFNPGANGEVYALAVQPDGKNLAGGFFGNLGGQSRAKLGRLNSDGSLDAGFSTGADGDVYALAVQHDSTILVGGNFTAIAGSPRLFLARLDSGGGADIGFMPDPDGPIVSMALQRDNKLVVSGLFSLISGQARSRIARLNADGTLDTIFNSGDSGGGTLASQPNGKIVVGGIFTMLGAQARTNIGRLNSDGGADAFDPGAMEGVLPNVSSVAIQPDGKVLVGGQFTSVGGQARTAIKI